MKYTSDSPDKGSKLALAGALRLANLRDTVKVKQFEMKSPIESTPKPSGALRQIAE